MRYAVFSDFFPDTNLDIVDSYEEALELYNDEDLADLTERNGATIYIAKVIKQSKKR